MILLSLFSTLTARHFRAQSPSKLVVILSTVLVVILSSSFSDKHPFISLLNKNGRSYTASVHALSPGSSFVRSFSSSPSKTATTARGMISTTSSDMNEEQGMLFGKFKILPSQIFFRSSLSAAIVNLRPIVPGHVLVIPKRVVPRLSDLNVMEYQDLWESVRFVQEVLDQHYSAGGFNVAVQDGKVSGQSVPHVHVHLLPRVQGDFERNDDIYDHLQEWAPTEQLQQQKKEQVLDVPGDNQRYDRTLQQMEEESQTYRNLFEDKKL